MRDRPLTPVVGLQIPLPPWLVSAYTRKDPASFLRLYIKHGLLSSAVSLARAHMEANLGPGKDEFGVSALHSTSHPLSVWLP